MATAQTTLADTDEEAWKDADLLHDLYHDEELDQSEIADKLGTTARTISYWMDKLEVDTTHTQHSEEEQEENLTSKCEYYEVCGNETPGPRNGLCDDCLDYARHNSNLDVEKNGVDRRKYDDMTEFMVDLREKWKKDSMTFTKTE